jgi:hypothetical protein
MKKPTIRKGEIHSVEFRPAKGGAVSTTRTKYKRGGTGGGGDYDFEEENEVHSNLDVGKIKAIIQHALANADEELAEIAGKKEPKAKG